MSGRETLHCLGMQRVLSKNYKWGLTFKNCGSLFCAPVTYIGLLYVNSSSAFKGDGCAGAAGGPGGKGDCTIHLSVLSGLPTCGYYLFKKQI